MSITGKINCFLIILIIILGTGGYVYYKKTHPKYTPPPIEPKEEINITIIPGWNLRQIADDWVKNKIIEKPEDLFVILGEPAYDYKSNKEKAPVLDLAKDEEWAELFEDKPAYASYEGYLFPDTYRVYADATPEDIFKKIFANLNKKITSEMREEIKSQGKTIYQVLTMASVVEKEAARKEDMSMVADIFWRRYKRNWALQSCATVNYITGKNDPGISSDDKQLDSPFNTYKYPGLPYGAISNPGIVAIEAVIYPKTNSYWYFMSGKDGITRYAETLDEHNANVYRYLR